MLDYYTESFNMTGIGIQPSVKVQYEYDALGKLSKYTVFAFNSSTAVFEQQHYLNFTFVGDHVEKIEGFLTNANAPYVQDNYQYLQDGRISKIMENNYAAVLTSEANFEYSGTANESVKVTYSYSNGGGFEYTFSYTDHNIQNDQITRGPELCSNGVYTYDKQFSPFNKLGYVDYELINFSINNKLTENNNYVNCSFPALVPDSHTYEYNEQGYPTVETTSYKNDSQMRSERRFYYKPGK